MQTVTNIYPLLENAIKTYLGVGNAEGLVPEKFIENWREIWLRTCQHKLQMVLHKVLQDEPLLLDAPILAQLKQYRLKSLQRSLLKLKALQEVVAAFASANIVVIPYKGLAFAECFYGDISMRSSVDIDLAIALSDIPASFVVMEALGYVENTKEKNGKGSNRKVLHKSRAYHIDYSWILYGKGSIEVNVELHWQPSHPVLHLPLTFADIPKSARTTLQISGTSIPTFTKPYLAVFTLVHHGLIDCWGQYRHLLDLAMMIKNLSSEEFLVFKKLLEKYKLLDVYYTGLYLLQQLFNYPITDAKYIRGRYQKLGAKLMKDIRMNNLSGKWSENPDKLLYHLQMRDTLYQKLATGMNLIRFKITMSS